MESDCRAAGGPVCVAGVVSHCAKNQKELLATLAVFLMAPGSCVCVFVCVSVNWCWLYRSLFSLFFELS